MRKALDHTTVMRTRPPKSGRLEIHDLLMPGLVLRITAAGHRSYAVRARQRNQQRNPIRVTLGPVHLYSLQEAREKAREVLRHLHEGRDPREHKQQQATGVGRNRTTVAAIAEQYIASHLMELRSGQRTAVDIRRTLVAEWGPHQIADITQDDIAGLIERYAAKGQRATALRMLAICKGLFRWASSPAREKTERLIVNPAASLQAKDFNLKPGRRQVKLTPDQLRAIWVCAGELREPWPAFFRFLLLSGQRRMEVAGMRWDEIDLDQERVWVIPAERMKSKRPHEVPLSPAMLNMLHDLRERPGKGPYVLSARHGRSPIAGMTKGKAMLAKAIEQYAPGLGSWQIHDIRRAVRTGLGALAQVPHDIRELVIAHVPPSLVSTYDLHGYREEKRQALTLWGERLARIVEPPIGTVVSLRAGQ